MCNSTYYHNMNIFGRKLFCGWVQFGNVIWSIKLILEHYHKIDYNIQ